MKSTKWWTLVFRITLALIFALVAFIFSEVVPELGGVHNPILLRILITLIAAGVGYGLFPDVARRITYTTMSLANIFTQRVTSEMMSQMMRLPRHQNPSVPFSHNAPVGGVSMNAPMILDTSAIIDGRMLDIAKTGFISGTILLPSFVLTELQQVADSSDFLKRNRGRRGFEIISELKKTKGIRVEVWDKDMAAKAVDDKLLKLAKSLNGRIITTDYNLNRVASLTGVNILNINDLANAVKTVAIPGEKLKVKVIHLGKDPKQGVGYLEDGTMVVVEDGAELVGKEVNTEVSRILQVSAGKMIFTKQIR